MSVQPGSLRASDVRVPGDPSQAAFWVVAACLAPGSDLTVENVYVGPSRAGYVEVLQRMGADVELVDRDEVANTASIRARYRPLVATSVGGAEVPRLIDEIPVLADRGGIRRRCHHHFGCLGAAGQGDRSGWRRRWTHCVPSEPVARGVLTAWWSRGVQAAPYRAGWWTAAGDHRIAMAAAVAGLASARPVTVSGWEAVETSYPGFEEDIDRCAS